MKRFFKTILKGLGFILGLLILYLFAVLILPIIPVNKTSSPNENYMDIYILTNGMHTDIVVPVVSEVINWSDLIPFSDTNAKQPMKYIALGWGDKGFYLDTPEWKDLKISTAFNAAFWLGDSAMHTTFYDQILESDDCKKISISKADYQELVKYLKNSFELDSNGKVKFIPTEMVYGNNDAFYEAKGTYSFLYTCNTWAAEALKVANQSAPLWTATQQGIFYYYK